MTYDLFTINFFPVIGITFMLLFIWRNSYLEKRVRNLYYVFMCLIAVELVLYDSELILEGSDVNHYIITTITALGYIVRPMMICLLISIIIRNYDNRRQIYKLLAVPMIINVFYSFSAFFTDISYSYDEYNHFHRGVIGWTPHLIMLVYLVIMVVITFRNKNKTKRFEKTIIAEITVILIIGAFAESLFGSYAVLRIAITAALLFYYMFFQSEVYKDDILERQIQQTEMVEHFGLQMITTLAGTVDAKDSYTKGHSLRVAKYAKEISRRIGKDEEFQKRIYYMGILHDVGKIGIPDTIIQKKGKLTDEEYGIIKTHPVIGEEVLKNITDMPDLYYGAKWHHERYDGKGYPDGLKGEEIPLEARIIAVADAYDAMSSKRSYRDALPQSKVRDETVRARGTQLDPLLADEMIKMIDEDPDYKMRETEE